MPVPLNPGKYREPSIFQPRDFLGYMKKTGHLKDDEKAPEAVILSYQKSLFDFVVKHHPVRFHTGYFKDHLAYLEETGGRVAIVGRFGIGAPAAAAMLEELIAWGVSSFVSIGTAGGLIKGLNPGAVVLCTGALRDEGVSYHYLPGGGAALPDETLSDALRAAFDSAGVPYRPGITWTTDSLYRETQLELDSVIELGAITVEMESSALFAVARYRETPIAACFTISDSLAELEWKPEFLSKDTNAGLEKLYMAAVDALRAQQ
jgi:uridine phosphorylase